MIPKLTRIVAFKPSFTMILTVTMALLMVATSAAMAMLEVRREKGVFADQVTARGLALSAAVTDTFAGPISLGDDQALADAVRQTRVRRELAYLVVLAPDGQPMFEESFSNSYSSDDDFGSNAIFSETVAQRTNDTLIEFASPIIVDGKAIAGVQYGFSTDALDSEVASVLTQRLLHTGLLVVLIVAASLMISRLMTGSIQGLMFAVRHVADGGEYLPKSGRVAELESLSDALGDMVANLRRASETASTAPPIQMNNPEGRASAPGTTESAAGAPPAVGQGQKAKQPQSDGQSPTEGLDTASHKALIDAQNRLQEALQKATVAEDAAKMATKSAHTINNLVTPITAYSKMARQKLPEGSPLIANMQEIEEAGNRIAELATEIQQFVPQAPLIEVTEAAAEQAAPPPPPEEVIENNVLIDQNSTVALVVDDESMVRRVTTALLVAEGYTVLEASNGVEGVEVAKRFSNVPIRLLVTDVLMPMMGAKDLDVILRDIHPETLVVYTSGYTSESLISHGAMDAQTTFVQKPLTSESLLEKIEEALVARTNEINEAAGVPTRTA